VIVKDKKCPKCGSFKVIPSVPIADNTYGGSVPWSAYITENPKAVLFKETHLFTIRAWICGECGYTELYADEPDKIASAYQRYLENTKSKKK
jgi:ribosomal protein S27AE